MTSSPRTQRSVHIASIMIIVAGVLTLLILAKKILIPIIIAVMLAYATIALSQGLASQISQLTKKYPPLWLTHILSIFILGGLVWVVWQITVSHIGILMNEIPFYEAQLITLTNQIGLDASTQVVEIFNTINIPGLLGNFASSLANIGSKAILIIIYAIFILIEFPSIKDKVRYLFRGHESQKTQTKSLLSYIARDVNTYFKIKTFASIATAVLCYIVLLIFQVDLALFWALLVFILNFIPTIGSIIAVLFPAALTLVQFASFGKFIVVLLLLIAAQLFIGNIVEPRIAGRALNISPLVILLSLVAAGVLWGVVGMILSVPMIIVIKIIAEQFPQTQSIAVMLSRDGTPSS
ncbi:AI-2E family transporter [Candidatus Nomurabacteria bacterium]|nr:AI-2E family transporter [Candidatus Nomurabacteria bacterium]